MTTFLYDDFGSLTNETVIGVAGTNTIERFYDNFVRDAGYALNGVRQSTLAYDPATGRLATMQTGRTGVPPVQGEDTFTWSYLPGSDLKSSLSYPNGLTASWQYDANNQLLQVRNAFPTNTISQYDYVYDAAGRRVQISRSGSAMSENRTDVYGYNERGELVSAAKNAEGAEIEYAYEYDDIGNRITSFDLGTNRTYIANCLNQYTQISNLCDSASLREEFHPQFDDDGNQTLIQTATGIWQVQYNGENRPIHWARSSDDTSILMSFDRMGRRVQYLETCGNATNENKVFAYDGYLQVANYDFATQNAQRFVWDPTEPIATLPLVFYDFVAHTQFYTHDGSKNVSELIPIVGSVPAHYEYAPFGLGTMQRGAVAVANPWRFSSEYYETDLSILCYNYRHYFPFGGRWFARDPAALCLLLYSFCSNNPTARYDFLGLYGNPVTGPNGEIWGPSSPFEPQPSIWRYCFDLRREKFLLYAKLKEMCPKHPFEKIGRCRCCDPTDCTIQAERIADAVYNKVRAMRANVWFGGLTGNFLAAFGAGYGCVEWQKSLVDEINAVMGGYEHPCFKSAGVGAYYPFTTSLTLHNWVKIIGCKTKYLLNYYILNDPGVELDPWSTGGDSMFGTIMSADDTTYWPE